MNNEPTYMQNTFRNMDKENAYRPLARILRTALSGTFLRKPDIWLDIRYGGRV